MKFSFHREWGVHPFYKGKARWENFKAWHSILKKKYGKHCKWYPNSDGIYFLSVIAWAFDNSGYYDPDGSQNYYLYDGTHVHDKKNPFLSSKVSN